MYLVGYCVGNIIGPQTFRPGDAPRYVPAEITIIVCWGICLCIMAFIYCWFRFQNKKKAQLRAHPSYVKLENQEWLDLTDRVRPVTLLKLTTDPTDHLAYRRTQNLSIRYDRFAGVCHIHAAAMFNIMLMLHTHSHSAPH